MRGIAKTLRDTSLPCLTLAGLAALALFPAPVAAEGARLALSCELTPECPEDGCGPDRVARQVPLVLAPLSRGAEGELRTEITLDGTSAVARANSARGSWFWRDAARDHVLIATVGDVLILAETDRQDGTVTVDRLRCEES